MSPLEEIQGTISSELEIPLSHFLTDVEEQFDKLLIEGDIKAINDYLFLNLYIIKFFRTVRHDEDEIRQSVDQLKEYIKEQQMKREMTFNN